MQPLAEAESFQAKLQDAQSESAKIIAELQSSLAQLRVKLEEAECDKRQLQQKIQELSNLPQAVVRNDLSHDELLKELTDTKQQRDVLQNALKQVTIKNASLQQELSDLKISKIRETAAAQKMIVDLESA